MEFMACRRKKNVGDRVTGNLHISVVTSYYCEAGYTEHGVSSPSTDYVVALLFLPVAPNLLNY